MSDLSENTAAAFLVDAPLQSWGTDSRFQRRESEAHPTKSAVIGMLAAALGFDKHVEEDHDRVKRLAGLRFTVYRLPRSGNSNITRLSDYHTVGGGYDKNASSAERLSIPRKASGPPFGTVLTRRTYLADARFAVALSGNMRTLRELVSALENPVWGIWFGRKACIPALPLFPVVGECAESALGALLERLSLWDGTPLPDADRLERWDEPGVSDLEDGDYFLHDAPVSFREREFTSRPVRHVRERTGSDETRE